MSLYRNLILASALALSGCKNETDNKPALTQTNPYGTQTTVQTDHAEPPGISHLKSDKVPNDSEYVAVICGKSFDSTSKTTFSWMQQQKAMSFYHVLPNEPMAKRLGLQEGQTMLYKNGKETCKSSSTFCDDLILEPGYHAHDGFSTIPPNGCQDGLVAGKKAPDFTYKNFKTNEPVTLKGLEGKVVLLDFWATWCGPCLKLQPYIQELAEKYPEIAVIGVNVDEIPDNLQRHLSKKQIPYTIVNDFQWTESPTVKKYGVGPIPDVFLIDQNGVVAARNIHYDLEKRKFTTEKLEAKIKALLNK